MARLRRALLSIPVLSIFYTRLRRTIVIDFLLSISAGRFAAGLLSIRPYYQLSDEKLAALKMDYYQLNRMIN